MGERKAERKRKENREKREKNILKNESRVWNNIKWCNNNARPSEKMKEKCEMKDRDLKVKAYCVCVCVCLRDLSLHGVFTYVRLRRVDEAVQV